eukprot:UN00572
MINRLFLFKPNIISVRYLIIIHVDKTTSSQTKTPSSKSCTRSFLKMEGTPSLLEHFLTRKKLLLVLAMQLRVRPMRAHFHCSG